MIKSLTLTVLFFVCFSFVSFSQWQWLNPKPSGYINSKIVFTDSLSGFIFNTNGDLISTKDQGVTWNFVRNFPNTSTFDLKNSTAVACGLYGTVFISKDKGVSWEKIVTPYTENFTMADVVSKDTIILANENGKIYRTGDGGQTWTMFNCNIHISSMEFINSSVGYVGGSSTYILKTEDGGVSWKESLKVNIIPSNTLALKFINDTTGFAFREHSTILKTMDAGKTWQATSISNEAYSFFFVTDNTGYYVGEYGVIYRTDDGGKNGFLKGPKPE